MKKYVLMIAFLVMGLFVFSTTPGPVQAARDSNLDKEANYFFLVELDGVSAGAFKGVDGLSIEQEVIEYQDGTDPLVRKRPGRVKYGDITLGKGYVAGSVLNDWIEAARFGGEVFVRKNMSIILLDEQSNEVKRWNCFDTFPRSWKLTPLDGKSGDILMEELVIVIEYFEEA